MKVYLDYSASTPVDKKVIEEIIPYFKDHYGNAASIHQYGRKAKSALESARENIARLLRSQPEEIYFTSGGTESDNWAIKCFAQDNREKGNHIITSNIEHPAVLKTCQYLEESGFEVTYLSAKSDGMLDLDEMRNSVKDTTILITLMHVNNEIGVINDMEAIGKCTHENKIAFHTDAVQSFGKIPIDVNKMNIDLLSISSHKIYGPKGIGALFIRKGTNISKYIHGGSNERNMRAGTENVPCVVGFGTAARLCREEIGNEADYLTGLRNYFLKEIKAHIPDIGINGTMDHRLPGNLNVSFKDADAESVLLSLDLRGISASSGSACAAGGIEPSPVIKALGLPPEYGQSAIRFTLGRYTTRKEINYTVSVLREVVERIRNL